ncbi:MAG: NAD(P)/FAD-dependent oxidoreductase [Balneolaceae bacterium]
MSKYDAIMIGSGHNGLITACYLAKAGFSVAVLEKRETVGGAVSTETMFRSEQHPGGFRIDIGSSVHIMIHQTGIPEELGLANYGLEYIDMDPFMSYPVPDGRGVIHFFRDLQRTLESIRQVAPEDVENYREFVRFWGRINRGVLKTFMKPPTGRNLVSELIRGQMGKETLFAGGQQTDGLQRIMSSYGKVVNDSFENDCMKAALIWFAAQSGPTPDMPVTGSFAGWQAMLHQSGAKHPRGGSGMLTQSMTRFIEAHGGVVKTGEAVASVDIRGGKARGVRTENNTVYQADLVVSNAHVQTTMLGMVGRKNLDDRLVEQVKNIEVGNGCGMVIRCAVEELPVYTAAPDNPLIHNGMQLLAPSVEYMHNAIGDYRKKQPPGRPAVLAMTFSAIDPEMAKDGGHTLYAWAQWHPYELGDNLKWDDIREREADKIYDVLVGYAPNMKGKVIDRYIQTPVDIERELGLLKGNVMHVDMNIAQMFRFRPVPALSRYETPVENLYLSSASCHPGGGVFGAAGYNAAKVILKKHKRRKIF